MASNYWIKLYHEILDDPKMGAMSHELWRRTIELFLMAGEYDKEGLLPPASQIAWKLRMTQQECNETLLELQRLCIVVATDDKNFVIKNFKKRQDALSSTERSRYHRAKKGLNGLKMEVGQEKERNDNATKRPIDTDTDIISKDSGKNPQRRKPKENKQTESIGPKTVVRNKFFELTGLSEPPKKTMGTWWGWFSEILTIGQSDPTKACHIMETVIVYMRNERLTITSPKSIINLARSVASGQELKSKNGTNQTPRASPPKVGDFDQDRYERLKRGEQ